MSLSKGLHCSAALWYNLILALHIRPLSTPPQVSYQSSVHSWDCRAERCEMAVFPTARPAGYYSKTSSAFCSLALLLWVQREFCRTTKAKLAHLPYKVCYCSASAEKGKTALFPLWYLIFSWHCRIKPKSCESNVELSAVLDQNQYINCNPKKTSVFSAVKEESI